MMSQYVVVPKRKHLSLAAMSNYPRVAVPQLVDLWFHMVVKYYYIYICTYLKTYAINKCAYIYVINI